jgi:hypothetical protein
LLEEFTDGSSFSDLVDQVRVSFVLLVCFFLAC